MAEGKEYFDPITGGAIPGGFIPDPSGSGNFIQAPSDVAGAYTGQIYKPGGGMAYTIDQSHADAAAQYGLKLGDQIDPTHPAFNTLFPKQKESGFDKALGFVLPKLIQAGMFAGFGGASGLTPDYFSPLDAAAPAQTAQTAVNAATGSGTLPPLAAPSSVSNFLSGVPEAVPGTTLPIGGQALDITAPGAAAAATAAGNALGPASGAPSLLPGVAPTPVTPPGGLPAPVTPANAPEVPVAPVTPPTPPTSVPGPEAPAPAPVTSATTAPVTGSPVGPGSAPGAPGIPGAPAPVTDLSIPASAADKARLASTSFIDKAIGAVTKNPLTAGALGLNVLSQINARKSGSQLDQKLAAAGAPASAAENQLLQQGLSGTPTASAAYDIDQWLKQTTSAIKQRYVNMGRDPSKDSAAAKELSDASAKASAMKDAAAQGLITQGLEAAKVAQGPITSAAIAGAQQDKDLAASIAQTLNSLAMLQALQSRTAA